MAMTVWIGHDVVSQQPQQQSQQQHGYRWGVHAWMLSPPQQRPRQSHIPFCRSDRTTLGTTGTIHIVAAPWYTTVFQSSLRNMRTQGKMTGNNNNDNHNNNNQNNTSNIVYDDDDMSLLFGKGAGTKSNHHGQDQQLMDDLSWRVMKVKLEEANTRRFLKAKPRFLPYAECRAWVKAWNRWDSERDWNNWIAMGEKRNSYIPSRPDEYYRSLGQWISWDHFLGKENGEELEGQAFN